jgi:retinol dehydrogenase-12
MGQFTFFGFVRSQWTQLPPVERVDLSEHTVVITGANVGLGFEAAKHFARMAPKHLVIVCRSKEKGEAALTGTYDQDSIRRSELMYFRRNQDCNRLSG